MTVCPADDSARSEKNGVQATSKVFGRHEDEIGITALRETARHALGDAIVPWFWSYRLRLGVK
jgi:hypothetical protein